MEIGDSVDDLTKDSIADLWSSVSILISNSISRSVNISASDSVRDLLEVIVEDQIWGSIIFSTRN